MIKHKRYTPTHVNAMLAMGVYFVITIAYLFFAPKFQYRHISGKIKLKSDTLLIYNLIRTNRCMANNKPAKTHTKGLTGKSISKFLSSGKLFALKAENKYCFEPSADHHFSFLFNRVLRI